MQLHVDLAGGYAEPQHRTLMTEAAVSHQSISVLEKNDADKRVKIKNRNITGRHIIIYHHHHIN